MRRKELIKSFVLIILVCSSIFLSYAIVNYKPRYEILPTQVDKQKKESFEKEKNNTLNLLAPYILVKHSIADIGPSYGEGTITKLGDVYGLQESQTLKAILENFSKKEVDYSRIRNQSINEVITQSKIYYTMEYKQKIDTTSVKSLYFPNDNQNSSMEFDRVLFSDFNKNSMYLYKNGTDNYMQVFFKDNIFSSLESSFSEKAKIYSKYLVGVREFYLPQDLSTYKIDEYSVKPIDINEVVSQVFDKNIVVKIGNIDEATREATDGYTILRENANNITYINPSNVNENNILKDNEVQVIATNSLKSGYLPNLSYSISEVSKNEINFRETYNSSRVYANDYPAQVSVQVTSNGVHRIAIPRNIRENLLSSSDLTEFHLENVDGMLNYLSANLNLNEIEDMELAYIKRYDEKDNKLVYSPTWHIKYQNGNYTFKEIREKFKKG